VIYTQNAELAGKQAGAELNKTAALDLTPEQPTPPKPPTDDRKPKRETLTRASTDRAALQAQAELEQKQNKIGNATQHPGSRSRCKRGVSFTYWLTATVMTHR
jgi:hypothetical protein